MFFSTFCFSQHTESYLSFANNFKFLDSSKVEIKWRNGKVKERKNIIKIEYKNTEYDRLTDIYTQFNRKGIKRTESLFDKYGNYLSYKFFDLDGNIITEFITLKIDYNEKGFVEITELWNEYMSSKNDVYLYKQGKKRNNKKIGTWLTFDNCGNIVKEKNFAN